LRVLITGGAGFIGSHLCDRLLSEGHEVICMDNLITGSAKNIDHIRHPGFQFFQYDVTNYNNLKVQFGLKLNVRKKIINELIIGEISTDNYSIENLTLAVRLLLKRIKKIRAITIVSFAINSHDEVMAQVINNVNFRKIDKKIFFVAKNFTNEDALIDNSKWSIFRGDLDTW
jgi:dTDP-D-glucose 4,6-dehydratase